MKKKTLFFPTFALLMTLSAVAGERSTALPKTISCAQFAFVNRLAIHLNVTDRTYEVLIYEPTNATGQQPEVIGSGQIASNIEEQGQYLTFSLYENGECVGSVKTVDDRGAAQQESPFYYKGGSYGDDASGGAVYCDYE